VLFGTLLGNTLGTYGTYWELEGNMFGNKEKMKKKILPTQNLKIKAL
jgi:hypothetical protein